MEQGHATWHGICDVGFSIHKNRYIINIFITCRLGRCQAIEDLFIIKFDPRGIICSQAALAETRALDVRYAKLQHREMAFFQDPYLMIGYVNIQKFKPHYEYIFHDVQIKSCDVIGIGETWIKQNEQIPPLPPQYEGNFINDNDGKGLAALYEKGNKPTMVEGRLKKGCYSMMKLEIRRINIIFLYISGEVSFDKYSFDLMKLIESDKPMAILGDVNWHYLNNHAMKDFMSKSGFKQLSIYPTHRRGRILDHIYVNELLAGFQVEVHQKPLHYTDHDFMFLKISLVPTSTPTSQNESSTPTIQQSPPHQSSSPQPMVIDIEPDESDDMSCLGVDRSGQQCQFCHDIFDNWNQHMFTNHVRHEEHHNLRCQLLYSVFQPQDFPPIEKYIDDIVNILLLPNECIIKNSSNISMSVKGKYQIRDSPNNCV